MVELNEEQMVIRKAARDFALGEFDRELAIKLEQERVFPREILEKARSLGFIGVHIPVEYGGQGYGYFENSLIAEEFCCVDSGIGICLMSCDFGIELLLSEGTDEQKQKFIAPVTKGKKISSAAYFEREDIEGFQEISIQLKKRNIGYSINGEKWFVPNGKIADFFLIPCPSGLNERQWHIAIVERDTDGLSINEMKDMMGMNMLSFSKLLLRGVDIPTAHCMVIEKDRLKLMGFFKDINNIEVAAQAVGIAFGSFDRALEYAKNRKQFGKKIIDFQVIKFKIADMYTLSEASRLLCYQAAYRCDHQLPFYKEAAMAKRFATDVAIKISLEGIQILGGYGYMKDYVIEKFLRDAMGLQVLYGTNRIQNLMILGELF